MRDICDGQLMIPGPTRQTPMGRGNIGPPVGVDGPLWAPGKYMERVRSLWFDIIFIVIASRRGILDYSNICS